MISQSLRGIAICLCAAALTACVSLLPRAKPVDLYRFEAPIGASMQPAPLRSVNVMLGNGNFAREAASDYVVALVDGHVVHLAGIRWALPAEVLFRQTVAQTFDTQPGAARLLRRGDPGHPDFTLSLDVTRFEIEYRAGRGAAPTIVVSFHALLVRSRDAAVIGESMYQGEVPADDNRVSAIVPAYNAALSDTLVRLSQWVQANVTTPAPSAAARSANS